MQSTFRKISYLSKVSPPILFGQFLSSLCALLFALYLFSSTNQIYASTIAKSLSLSSLLATIIKLGSDTLLISRLRHTRKSLLHSKLSLYASSFLLISSILFLFSLALSLCIPLVYQIPSISICLFSLGLVLLSYTSNFLITSNHLFLGLVVKPAPLLASVYIAHFFTASVTHTALIALVLPVLLFQFTLNQLKIFPTLPRSSFFRLFIRKSTMSLLFSVSQSASYNILIFAPNTFALLPSQMNLFQKLVGSSSIILRLIFIRAPRAFASKPLAILSILSLPILLATAFSYPHLAGFVSLMSYAFILSILNLSKIPLVDRGFFSLVLIDQILVFILFLIIGVSPISLFAAAILNSLLVVRLASR